MASIIIRSQPFEYIKKSLTNYFYSSRRLIRAMYSFLQVQIRGLTLSWRKRIAQAWLLDPLLTSNNENIIRSIQLSRERLLLCLFFRSTKVSSFSLLSKTSLSDGYQCVDRCRFKIESAGGQLAGKLSNDAYI